MNIIEMLPTLGSGGAEKFVCEISNELIKRQGVDLSIVTLFDLNDTNSHNRNNLVNQIKVVSLGKKKGFDIVLFWKIYKFIKKSKAQVVHAHSAAITYIFLATLLLPKVRFFATIHSEASREAGKLFQKWSRKIMFGFSKCAPITISRQTEQSFVNFYGIHANLIENGIAPYSKQTVENPLIHYKGKVFVHVASIQPVKNPMRLVSAFEMLIADGEDISLVMMGNNTSYKGLYAEIEKHLTDRILHIGLCNDTKDFMKYAEGMCLSSDMEGMPITIIEAFSVGCVPLCTPVGGCCDMIVHGVNGMLAEDMSNLAYYRMLKKYLAMTDEERAQMKENSKQSFERYNIVTVADRYLNLFNKYEHLDFKDKRI